MRCGGSCGVSLCWFIAHTNAGCVSVGGKRAGLDGVAGTAMMALRRGHRGATRESIVGRVQERLAILLPMTGILAPFSPRGEKKTKREVQKKNTEGMEAGHGMARVHRDGSVCGEETYGVYLLFRLPRRHSNGSWKRVAQPALLSNRHTHTDPTGGFTRVMLQGK